MANYNVGDLEFSISTVGSEATTSLSSVNSQLKIMLNLCGGTNTALDKMSKNFNKGFNFTKVLGKLYAAKNSSKQFVENIKGMVKSGVDYAETLNLWQVSMRGNIDMAEEFITKMNKGYGIAASTLMQYQATFRNMLNALGGISSNVSYELSEYLTQMAVDYASLYNTTIDKAMTVFQSVLSGQTKPVRSISGYDITETTIYELYQQLGGTKTMRQLSQTEKRLLRIYAVFQQMNNSGAIGDLSKTLDNTANQMRITQEAVKELGEWVGKFVEVYIAPALPYINAFLITVKNIAEAIVKALPGYSEFDGTINGLETVNNEIDEVQGKLLDFDKFRALDTSTESELDLGIDDTVLDGMKQYISILDGVSNKAADLAKEWTSWWINDETGELTDQAKKLYSVLKNIAKTVGILIGFKIVSKIGVLVAKVISLVDGFTMLNITIKTGIVASVYKMVEAFNEGNTVMGVVYGIITGGLLIAYAAMLIAKQKDAAATKEITKSQNKQLNILTMLTMQQTAYLEALTISMGAAGEYGAAIERLNAQMTSTNNTVEENIKATKSWGSMATTAISSAVTSFALLDSVIGGLEGTAKTTVSILSIVFGALAAILGVILAIKGGVKGGLIGATVAGLGVGALIAGIKGVATAGSNLQDIAAHKNGGVVEDGIFTMSKGEIIGDFDDGTTVVANNQQIISGIEQGVYKAVSAAMQGGKSGNGNKNVYNFQVNGRTLLSVMEDEMHKQGKKLSRY